MKYYQCLLKQDEPEEWMTITWIPAKEAKVGLYVNVLKGPYRVMAVYPPGIPEKALKRKQKADKDPFPSIIDQALIP